MAKPKMTLRAEITGYEPPDIVEVIHPDGFRQYFGDVLATFYRMKCVVDGEEETARWFRDYFGDVERVAC